MGQQPSSPQDSPPVPGSPSQIPIRATESAAPGPDGITTTPARSFSRTSIVVTPPPTPPLTALSPFPSSPHHIALPSSTSNPKQQQQHQHPSRQMPIPYKPATPSTSTTASETPTNASTDIDDDHTSRPENVSQNPPSTNPSQRPSTTLPEHPVVINLSDTPHASKTIPRSFFSCVLAAAVLALLLGPLALPLLYSSPHLLRNHKKRLACFAAVGVVLAAYVVAIIVSLAVLL